MLDKRLNAICNELLKIRANFTPTSQESKNIIDAIQLLKETEFMIKNK